MRNAILALLAAGSAYGYEIKQAFDRLFGAAWPSINIGQIYTSLQRLERDGLVVSETVPQERKPSRVVYRITDAGRDSLKEWFSAPGYSPRLRDDLFMKLVLAKSTGMVNPVELVRRQSEEYFQALSDLDTLVATANSGDDRIERLLIEGIALHIQADLRWLEVWEQMFSKEEEA